MKINVLILAIISISFIKGFAQDSLSVKKENTILFGELTVGRAVLEYGGAYISTSISYQKNNNLFKFDFSTTIRTQVRAVHILIPLPIFSTKSITNSYALLYGKRYFNKGFSYSFLGGISYIKSKIIIPVTQELDTNYSHSNHIGLPLEFNIKWFKEKKKRFRIFYGIIPIGKPTSFGRSIGFKLFANLSKTPYLGLGLTLGLGNHKIYN